MRGYACRYLSTTSYASSACIPGYAFTLDLRQCPHTFGFPRQCEYVCVHVPPLRVCLCVCMHSGVYVAFEDHFIPHASSTHVPKDHTLQMSLTTVNAAL